MLPCLRCPRYDFKKTSHSLMSGAISVGLCLLNLFVLINPRHLVLCTSAGLPFLSVYLAGVFTSIWFLISPCLQNVRCLKRFVHRKGLPYLILSDNGKTFKGQELKQVLLKSGITWRFNISKASWTGGVFERLVRSLKRVF